MLPPPRPPITSGPGSGLERTAANHQPLSPISMLERTAAVFAQRPATIHGATTRSWAEVAQRVRRLASALTRLGIGKGDVVAVMAPNIPQFVEAHFAVPMAGAVLNALNVRLDAATLAHCLDHGGARVLLTDTEYAAVVAQALARLASPPLVIDIADSLGPADGQRLGAMEYEALLAGGDPDFPWRLPDDEWDPIALNYTSGTTSLPKGVVYSHRGATLNAWGEIMAWPLPRFARYLWVLPMFHCNGWCFPWAVTAMAGTHVCLRRAEGAAILEQIGRHQVTHLCGAPIIMSMIADEAERRGQPLDHPVAMMTAAAPPPAATLARMQRLGITVTHVYGLTEVYGPATLCEWDPDWDRLDIDAQADLKARQGVAYPVLSGLSVRDPDSDRPVPADGQTLGEICMQGNIVMNGYLRQPDATAQAFRGGWFRTGDLAVVHGDGYVQIRDRAKDIIISGGENISSIEVETVLYRHPAVAEAAVVARPDTRWGEHPCAFVTLRAGAMASEAELIAFCRQHLAHFKAPRTVIFAELPKTSTGKIQKRVLRDRANALGPA